MNPKAHWEAVYTSKAPEAVSWYAPHLERSLDYIRKTGLGPDAALIDIGGGESTLVDDLLAAGFRDLSVLDSLAQSGDDPDVMRTVDHMVYFQTETAANEFGVWASAQGYEVEEIAAHEGNEYRVRFTHQGTMQLGDITGHTLAISHQAQELGGEYDGWGTVVCSREEK